jgi:hypothetical protein
LKFEEKEEILMIKKNLKMEGRKPMLIGTHYTWKLYQVGDTS